jgi:hypothetical protein
MTSTHSALVSPSYSASCKSVTGIGVNHITVTQKNTYKKLLRTFYGNKTMQKHLRNNLSKKFFLRKLRQVLEIPEFFLAGKLWCMDLDQASHYNIRNRCSSMLHDIRYETNREISIRSFF